MKVSTGIKGLDKFLDGGFQPGSVVLVEGIKASKDIYSVQFLDNGVFITTMPAQDIINTVKKFKWDKKIKIISIGGETGDKIIDGPSSLEDISIAIDELLKENKGNIVINSLSSLMLHNSLERIVDFLQSITQRCKKDNSVLMIVIDEKALKDKDRNTIKDISNSVVAFVKSEAGQFIKVEDDCPDSQLEFDIGKNGIEIKEEFL
jgi:KaiC/GvpD/RAD55 family RecA-like ATPase